MAGTFRDSMRQMTHETIVLRHVVLALCGELSSM